jgi:hypothetical protein
MTFECPVCKKGGLAIQLSMELMPGGDDDDVTLQTIDCGVCGFRGIAVYRESRHGALRSERWHHHGYAISEESLEAIRKALIKCPDTGNRRCGCETHAAFGGRNWTDLAQNGIDAQKKFEMKKAE